RLLLPGARDCRRRALLQGRKLDRASDLGGVRSEDADGSDPICGARRRPDLSMAHAARAGRDGTPPAVRRLREMAALWRKAGGSHSAPSLRTAAPVTVLLVLFAYNLIQYVTLVFQTPRQLDFYVFWLAPRIGLAQGWAQMYNPARFLPELVAQTGNWLPYLNPPVFAWLLLPLSLLPYPVALVIWNALILGCLVVIWRVTVWRAAPTLTLSQRGREILLLLAALALYPVVLGLALGQV